MKGGWVLLCAPLLLGAAGCVTGSFSRKSYDDPIGAQQLAALRPAADTLTSCLAALGAPNRVFEHGLRADGTAGMALLWCWRDASGWGLQVSVGTEDASGSLSIDRVSTDLPGCMLWFGPDLVLERWRSGLVGDLVPSRRRPTMAIDGG